MSNRSPDDLPVNHSITQPSIHLKPDGEVFTFKTISQQLEGGEPDPRLQNDECDFTVPVRSDETCQSRELRTGKDIDSTTSMAHFPPQECRGVPPTALAISSDLEELRDNSQNISADCEIHLSPSCKRPRLHENSTESSKDDTGKLEAVEQELYLDWNACNQFESELMNKGKLIRSVNFRGKCYHNSNSSHACAVCYLGRLRVVGTYCLSIVISNLSPI